MNGPGSGLPARTSRRAFLRRTSMAATGTAVLSRLLAARSHARGDETLRLALVGCGGRGTGAAFQALSTAGPVTLVAVADAFRDRLDGCLAELQRSLPPDRIDVPEERRFTGFDAYRKAIDAGVDVVILTTPPGFRPEHFAYAVQQGKHVFMEKPVAVDAPGVRRVLDAAAQAKEKNLKVGVGLQRRHEAKYQETVQRIRDGAIGDIVLLRAYWNGAGVWVVPRRPGMTEMEYQMRNWYYFNWLCGDHIVEQHIHNLDVCNWIQGEPPISAQGQGGRQVRTGKDHGEIFDHHFVEFTYRSGARMLSQCRHIPGCWESVSEHAHGTRGEANVTAGRIQGPGGWDWRFRGEHPDPYQVEHDRLFAAIRNDEPFNEAETGALATMTAILGRMATYSGRVIAFDDALAAEASLMPQSFAWDAAPPTLPDADGHYRIAVPGATAPV